MKHLLISIIFLGLIACNNDSTLKVNSIIPLPEHISGTGETLVFNKQNSLKISYDQVFFKDVAVYFSDFLNTDYQFTSSIDSVGNEGEVAFVYKAFDNPEAYELTIGSKGIVVQASSAPGAFYAVQSLKQLFPLRKEYNGEMIKLAGVTMHDKPLFSYRGAHLDVARHFFSADSIKRFIDILAMHKLNKFHWHLTEDQGWRVEIKKYPKLTEIGAYRPRTVIGRNSQEYDTIPHGGFYTQDEIREIVQYAAERYITVIPEIDMPGHMMAALAAYPELGCHNKKVEVAQKWGVFEDVLCGGDEKVYDFVFNVLDEVMELFPSKYIHIGGDECPKDEWEKCATCQAKIKQLGLKSDEQHTAEQKLQSYFSQRVESYLNENGRLLVGWDEISEGGISKTATLMAWRSPEYGYEAARNGNDAILTPNQFFYLDYYQTDDITGEPLAIGGCTTVERVYSFEPFQGDLPDSIKKHILGVQANVWTEYMKTFNHVEYMLLPRLAALSEVAWSSAPKDYPDFISRLGRLINFYDQAGYNYGKHIFDIRKEYIRDTIAHTLHIELSALNDAQIRYTIDGSEPTKNSTLYKQPIAINSSMELKAKAFYNESFSRTLRQKFDFNLATLKPIRLNTPSYHDYTFNGALLLNDGLTGEKSYRSGNWLGYNNEDLSVTIDLMEPTEISEVSMNAFVTTADWVFRPTFVQVYSSLDDVNYELLAEQKPASLNHDVFEIETYTLTFDQTKSRYIKVVMGSLRTIPQWHPAKGLPAFIFVDEISVN